MRPRTGLTLVELLAGLVIAALLSMAALAVASGLLRSERLGRKAHEAESMRAALGRLFEADLLGAARFREVEGGFQLDTFSCLASGDLARSHLKAVVTYEVRAAGGRPCLVRGQESEREEAGAELVATGVRDVRIRPVGSEPKASRDGWKALGAAAAVTVVLGDGGGGAETFELLVRKR
jgi:prepilin-type N-terminal cleavage/methylation domain-containing protein